MISDVFFCIYLVLAATQNIIPSASFFIEHD